MFIQQDLLSTYSMPDTGQDAGVAKMEPYHLTDSRIPYCGGGERQSMVILG